MSVDVDNLLTKIRDIQVNGPGTSSKTVRVKKLIMQLKELTAFLPTHRTTAVQRMYCLENNITSNPICAYPGCNKFTEFLNVKEGYSTWCSKECSCSDYGKEFTSNIRKQTNIEKYGTPCPIQSENISNKIKSQFMEKYGVDNVGSIKIFHDKQKRTNMERYGAEHPWGSNQIKENIKHTNLSKYGVESIGSAKQFREKIKESNLRKYGFECATKNPYIREKTKQTLMLKYNRCFANQEHISEDALTKLNDKTWLTHQHTINKFTLTEISKQLNVCDRTVGIYFKKHEIPVVRFYQSSGEREVCTFLDEINVQYETNSRKVIKGNEIDIFIPKYNLAIEYCGVYWHSESAGRDRHYHLSKLKKCEEQGIRLLTIFEDEWHQRCDVIKMLIKQLCHYPIDSSLKLYARNTSCTSINKRDAKKFFDEYHIQGNGSSNYICGLVDKNNTLVACLAFKFTKTEIYLVRYATSGNIVGGFSKLLNYFIRSNNVTLPIVTFADRRISCGQLYYKCGFKLHSILDPDYCYSLNGHERIHKFNFRRKFLPKLLKNFDPALSERINCDNNNVHRIWDCGKYRFIYDKHIV